MRNAAILAVKLHRNRRHLPLLGHGIEATLLEDDAHQAKYIHGFRCYFRSRSSSKKKKSWLSFDLATMLTLESRLGQEATVTISATIVV